MWIRRSEGQHAGEQGWLLPFAGGDVEEEEAQQRWLEELREPVEQEEQPGLSALGTKDWSNF